MRSFILLLAQLLLMNFIFVHALVGITQQIIISIRGSFVDMGAAKAKATVIIHYFSHILHKAFACVLQTLLQIMLRSPRGKNYKFVAANAKNMLALHAHAFKQTAHALDIVIALFVSGMVVTALKLIHINKGHCAGHALFPQVVHVVIKGPAIADAGEAIGGSTGF